MSCSTSAKRHYIFDPSLKSTLTVSLVRCGMYLLYHPAMIGHNTGQGQPYGVYNLCIHSLHVQYACCQVNILLQLSDYTAHSCAVQAAVNKEAPWQLFILKDVLPTQVPQQQHALVLVSICHVNLSYLHYSRKNFLLTIWQSSFVVHKDSQHSNSNEA